MTTVLFDGGLGGGKTMTMTWRAYEWSLAANGAPIAANYWINPALFKEHAARNPYFKIHLIRTKEDLVRFIVEGGGILAWDEMYQEADARLSTQTANIFLSQWLMFLRKFGITPLYSVQDPAQVDRRMRAVTDLECYCERRLGESGPYVHVTTRHFRTGTLLREEDIGPDLKRFLHTLYDTYEVVDRMALPLTATTFQAFIRRCGEAARFARGYRGPRDRAWEAFISQSPDTEGETPKGRKNVSQPSHVRKSAGRAASNRGGPDSGDGPGPKLAQKAEVS